MLFTSSGVVKLADFGLSKILDRNQRHAVSLVGVSTSVGMSPEIAEDAKIAKTRGYLAPVRLISVGMIFRQREVSAEIPPNRNYSPASRTIPRRTCLVLAVFFSSCVLWRESHRPSGSCSCRLY